MEGNRVLGGSKWAGEDRMHWHHGATLTFSSLLKAALDVTAADRATLYLLEGETEGWRVCPIAAISNGNSSAVAAVGDVDLAASNKVVDLTTLLGACAKTGKIINIQDAASNAAFGATSMGTVDDDKDTARSVLCVPLMGGDGTTKVIVFLASAQKCYFTRAHELCMRALVSVGASSAEDIAHLPVPREHATELLQHDGAPSTLHYPDAICV